MTLFTSTYENKLDWKGRVSVPARYRALLKEAGQALFVTCSLTETCLDGMGHERLTQFSNMLDGLDIGSDEAKAVQFLIFTAQEMRPDSDGRIVLPEKFISHAQLKDTVIFAGSGRWFQIWNPDNFRTFEAESRDHMKEGKLPPLTPTRISREGA